MNYDVSVQVGWRLHETHPLGCVLFVSVWFEGMGLSHLSPWSSESSGCLQVTLWYAIIIIPCFLFILPFFQQAITCLCLMALEQWGQNLPVTWTIKSIKSSDPYKSLRNLERKQIIQPKSSIIKTAHSLGKPRDSPLSRSLHHLHQWQLHHRNGQRLRSRRSSVDQLKSSAKTNLHSWVLLCLTQYCFLMCIHPQVVAPQWKHII